MLGEKDTEFESYSKCSPKLSGEHNCQNQLERLDHTVTVSHDWIEFTGEMQSVLPINPFLFNHKDSEHGTPYFVKLYKVFTLIYGEELEFCNLEIQPRPSFLSPSLVKVKVHNRFCYTPNVVDAIELFLREYNIKFKHYTRIDYAIDFQKVAGYGYDIQKMMHAFASKRLLVKSKSLKTHSLISGYTGLTWGSRTSGVSILLYNKSLEMIKKGQKPWINDLWTEALFTESVDVYRLEFSTKKPKFDMVQLETGEYLGSYSEIDFLTKQTMHINFLYQNYFQIAFSENGKRFSRCRHFNPLPFFMDIVAFIPITPCIKPQSTNIHKTIIKKIVLEAAFLEKEGKFSDALYAWKLALKFVGRYSLQKWWQINFENLEIKSSYISRWQNKIQSASKMDSAHFKNRE